MLFIRYVHALLKLRYIHDLLKLNYQNNLSLWTTLINDLNNINTAIASLNSNGLFRVILYGNKSFNKETNCKILTASIKFIKDT